MRGKLAQKEGPDVKTETQAEEAHLLLPQTQAYLLMQAVGGTRFP